MKKIQVVAALLVKENKVLIAQRMTGGFEGLWEFPGGKIEDGETPQEALEREIYEEFEVKIKVGELIHNVVYNYTNFILDMDCFLCSIIDNSNIKLHDHHKVKWISLDTPVNEIDWVPADIEVYEGLQEHFRSL